MSSASGSVGAGLELLLILEAVLPFTDCTAYLCCITVGGDLREQITAFGSRSFVLSHVVDINNTYEWPPYSSV